MPKPKRPTRMLILTSVRDVGACDLNGRMISTREGPKYMMGIVEHAVRECRPRGALDGLFELAGVVTDDTAKDLRSCEYPPLPLKGKPWIHRPGLEDHFGTKIADLTVNVPSVFRSLPREDVEGRHAAKEVFESQVRKIMQDAGADVLMLDHYMARIEFLINGEFGLYGRVLNIHPAVTLAGHPFCFRGPTPTADALTHAKENAATMTGATLHLVNAEFDDGPVVHWDAPTPVHAVDTPAELRCRNYRMAKRPVFTEGMKKYRQNVFPDT